MWRPDECGQGDLPPDRVRRRVGAEGLGDDRPRLLEPRQVAECRRPAPEHPIDLLFPSTLSTRSLSALGTLQLDSPGGHGTIPVTTDGVESDVREELAVAPAGGTPGNL